jgi:hypothetical protein
VVGSHGANRRSRYLGRTATRGKLSHSHDPTRSETKRSRGGSSGIAALRLRAEFDLLNLSGLAASGDRGLKHSGEVHSDMRH